MFSFGLAFVGGFSDAASFILANTFTGHVTGNFVLIAVSLARRDWPTLCRRGLAIFLFLLGVLLSAVLEQWLARKPSRSFLPAVLALEIALMLSAYAALSLHLAWGVGIFVLCMALALGLQNGAWRESGGIAVHSTYLTGMLTNLFTTGAQRYIFQAPPKPGLDHKVSLLWGIWIAFVLGAAVGAALVFHFAGPGILGAALVLLALMIHQVIITRRP